MTAQGQNAQDAGRILTVAGDVFARRSDLQVSNSADRNRARHNKDDKVYQGGSKAGILSEALLLFAEATPSELIRAWP